ncbi:MAG: endonuclease domain-containing protein [Propionibacteriaceae bacterium]|nr:endonuclease domain-containing protein [Propionibacteriaceae bacterium]
MKQCDYGFARKPQQILVFVGASKCVTPHPSWIFVRSSRQRQGSPPRTTLAEAIIDAGETWKTDDLVHLLGRALNSRDVTTSDLLKELDSRAFHHQRNLMKQLIGEVGEGTTSVLERLYRRTVEKAHGLPAPQRQVSPTGRYRVDHWYQRYHLIIEVDGKAYHQGAAAINDIDRDNHHQAAGITTLRLTWSHVAKTPCATARLVGKILQQAGWKGKLRQCGQCSSPIEFV